MKQLGEIKVREYMTEQAIVIDDTARLTDAIRLMDVEKISVVPVVDEQGKLTGILSNRDLIELTYEIQSDLGAIHYVNEKTRDFLIQLLMDQGDNARVADVMTSPVSTISPETNLVVAAQLLNSCGFHHLPVVEESGTSIGILSTSDFVRAIAEKGALMAG